MGLLALVVRLTAVVTCRSKALHSGTAFFGCLPDVGHMQGQGTVGQERERGRGGERERERERERNRQRDKRHSERDRQKENAHPFGYLNSLHKHSCSNQTAVLWTNTLIHNILNNLQIIKSRVNQQPHVPNLAFILAKYFNKQQSPITTAFSALKTGVNSTKGTALHVMCYDCVLPLPTDHHFNCTWHLANHHHLAVKRYW